MRFSSLLLSISLSLPFTSTSPLVHPGLLHTASDFDRIASKVSSGSQPWLSGFQKLSANRHSQLSYRPRPQAIIVRGLTSKPQNYAILFNDIAAAYALAIRWKVTGDTAFAKAGCEVVDAWSNTLVAIEGNGDRFLAAGIYGFEFANAIEILRGYEGWYGFPAARDMLLTKFYPMSKRFLALHNDARVDHYWANWDLVNLNAILAIGVVSDNRTMFQEAVDYFYNGTGNGAITKAIWKIHHDVDGQDLGQLQESGRDQGHCMLLLGMLGSFAQMATNQGVALFTHLDARILKGAEYAAKFNLGYDVPYDTYRNSDTMQTVISGAARGTSRPIWELLYNRYAKIEKLNATYTAKYAERVRNEGGGAEGGGGDYGPNSGGFDHLGYGTLMFSV